MKRVLSLVVMLSVMFLGVSNVDAMTPTFTNGIRYSRGVKNTCYYISPSASGYASLINIAASQWANMSNNIVNTPVSSSYATHIDFYSANPSNNSILNSIINAYTTIWDANGAQLFFNGTSNYFYAEIVINNQNYIDSSTIAHEMGHAYGLDHTSNKYSIMYTPKNDRLVSTPQSVDNDTINYLYP